MNAMPEVRELGLRFRFPKASEWEYACRAGGTGDYCRLADGSEITADTLGKVAWYDDNSGNKTHPVGQKEPNAFGLYDMHGNVWEWCDDYDGNSSYVRRGGSWDNHLGGCRASYRDSYYSSNRYRNLGFRLVAFQKVKR